MRSLHDIGVTLALIGTPRKDQLDAKPTQCDAMTRLASVFLDSLRDLWTHRELATLLAIRDTKAKYRSSLLGLLWAVAPPILAAIGLTSARNAGMLNLGHTPIPFPAYVVLGFSLWQVFTAALTRPMQSLASARNLLSKVAFPREVIVLSELNKLIVSVGVHAVLVGVVFFIYQVPIASTAPLVIVPLTILILLGLAIGLLLAPAALLIGDILNALPFLTGALLIITPVAYVTPENSGLFATVVKLNPLTPIFEWSRLVLSVGIPPNLAFFSGVAIFSTVLLILALVVFRISMPVVVERWSA